MKKKTNSNSKPKNFSRPLNTPTKNYFNFSTKTKGKNTMEKSTLKQRKKKERESSTILTVTNTLEIGRKITFMGKESTYMPRESSSKGK